MAANDTAGSGGSMAGGGGDGGGGGFPGEVPLEHGFFENLYIESEKQLGGVPVPMIDLILCGLGVCWSLLVTIQAVRMSRVREGSSTIVLLPIYKTVLFITAFCVLVFAFGDVGLAMYSSTHKNKSLKDFYEYLLTEVVVGSVTVALFRLPSEFITYFMMQHNAGTRAMKLAILGSFMSFLLTLNWPMIYVGSFLVNSYVDEVTFVIPPDVKNWTTAWISIVYVYFTALYLLLWFAPSRLLYRRPALRPYAAYWCVQMFIGITTSVLAVYREDTYWLFQFISHATYFLGAPPVMYHAMVTDSLFWQGYHPKERSAIAQLIAPLDGIRYTLSSFATLSNEMDRLSATCSVHQLNFRFLHLDNDRMLGAGAQARVYAGTYKKRKVAIKMVFCIELSQEIVADFANEARLLTTMAHPNIVETLGICVVPPTISIVMELCGRGSLGNVLASDMPLSWRTKLRLCQDCARAVAFMHSRNAMHKDIKSLNFLVTDDMVVKLTDLGVSDENSQDNQAAQTFRGTLNWAAPEALAGDAYTPASDVYSLIIVLWEVASRHAPFDTADTRNLKPDALTAAVLGKGEWRAKCSSANPTDAGLRPPLPTNIPADFTSLLVVGWSPNPQVRPTAAQILSRLDGMVAALPAEGAGNTAIDSNHVAKFRDAVNFGTARLSLLPQPAEAETTINPLVSHVS